MLAILPPMVMMFLIFYFILIRPQKKQQQAQRQMREDLKEGDQVITMSGIHGTIKKLKDDIVTLQIADTVRIKIDRQFIGRHRDEGKTS